MTFINLDLINKLAETINYIVGTLGIIAGGIWVYWKFIFQRVGKWNLGLEIFPEIIPYDDQTALLKIVVKLKNKGSVKISPCNKGCRLTVRSICHIGNDNLLNLDSGSPIINDYDMLKKYYKENSGYKAYEIEPLCEYSEVEVVLVPKGGFVSIRVEFFSKDNDSITEYAFCKID